MCLNFSYKFYQYWINSSDEDAANYIRIFTLKSKDEIEASASATSVSKESIEASSGTFANESTTSNE